MENPQTVDDLLDELEDILEQSSTMPFTGKTMVNKDEILEIITEIRLKLPNELKQSKWVLEERNKILIDAQKEAEAIVKDGGATVNRLVDEHEISRAAKALAEKIVADAKSEAKELRLGAIEYADEVLALIQNTMTDSLNAANKESEEMLTAIDKLAENLKEEVYQQAEKNQQFYSSNLNVIYKNRQELRGK